MNRLQIVLLSIIGAGLWACSSVSPLYVQTDKVEVNTSTAKDDELASFIEPYRDSLALEMERVIAYAKDDFTNERPVGALGNFVVDQTMQFVYKQKLVQRDDYICIMNYGGLRSPINQGDVNVGDIYKLMPFDNTIVLLKLPAQRINEITSYLRNTGGEPIGGFKVTSDSYALNGNNELGDTLFVVTTDYLANGGDRMDFLKNAYEKVDTGIFLRDILLEKVEEKDSLVPNVDERIKL
jgi:2',3'-cyclic-nucleotide 2'-phosphodiesterase (5'-nucleotidase family)